MREPSRATIRPWYWVGAPGGPKLAWLCRNERPPDDAGVPMSTMSTLATSGPEVSALISSLAELFDRLRWVIVPTKAAR